MKTRMKVIIGAASAVVILAVVLLLCFLLPGGTAGGSGESGRLLTSSVPAELWWHSGQECEVCDEELEDEDEEINDVSGDYINITNGKGDIFNNSSVGDPWEPGEYRIAFLEVRNTGSSDMKYTLMQEISHAEGTAAPAGFKYVLLNNMTYKLYMRNGLTNWNSLAKAAAAQDAKGNTTSSGAVVSGAGLLAADVTVPAGKTEYLAVAVYYDGKASAAYTGLTYDVRLFCSSTAQEGGERKVFYVSPDGHDGNPGTEAAPLKSFRRAAQLAKPGETYIFEDGTYYEGGMTVMMNSGTAEAPIIFKSRNKGGAVVIYPESLMGNHKIYIWEKEYITIEGFELTQAEIADDTHPNAKTDMIIRCGFSNNITIRNNEIHHAWEEPIKMSRGHNILIEGNYIHDGGYEAIDCVNLSDSIIRDNDIAEVGRMALMCKGGSRSVLFYNNYVHTRERTIQNAFGIGGISNNTSIWGGTPNHWEAFNVYVFNNIVVAENAGKIDYGVCFIGAKDCGAFNNILVGCNWGVMYRVPDDMNYGWEWNPTNLNTIFKNNVVMDSQQSACVYIDGEPINLDSDYNLYYNNAGTDPVEPHSIYNKDPGFVASKGDWNLREDSPLRGAGTPVSGLVGLSGESFFVGFDKNYILRGDTWDIGVYDTDGTESHDPGGLIYNNPEWRNPIDNTIYEAPVFSSMPEAGTILLEEDFESSTAMRDWVECSSSRGRWLIRGGNLTMDNVTGRVTIRYKEGVTWSDYEFTAKVLSPSLTDLDNCSGVIFRADDEMKNMYGFRFLPGAVTNKLELCAWNNGSFTSLSTIPFEWEANKMYEMKVIAVGSDFAFYIDGEKVMTAIDGSHAMGTVGVYSYRESHLFDDILVVSAKGEVVEQLPAQDTVPEYTGQILLDEMFIDSTVMSDWKALKGEWKIVEETMTEVGGPIAAGDRRIIYTKGYDWKNYEVWVDVYLPEEASESAGILFSYSADGSKYYGFRFVGNNTYVFNETGKIYVEPISGYPKGTVATLKAIVEDDTIRIYLNSRKLWEQEDVETTPGTIGLYLNSSMTTNYFDNIQVFEIESDYTGSGGSGGSGGSSGTTSAPAYKPTYTGNTLLNKNFNTNEALTDWLVIDESGKRQSNWQIANGVLKETSDTSKLGGTAMLLYKNGSNNWKRYEYTVDLVVPDDTTTGGRSVGVIFGSDAKGKDYYYFRIMYNGMSFFKYLYRVTPEGTEQIVHEQKVSNLTPGCKVRVTVFVEGKRLKIYLGNQEVYNGKDLKGLSGTVGLYLRGDIPNNSFDNMTVKELSAITVPTTLLDKNFNTAENLKYNWLVKDSSRESDWQVVDGVLKETSPADTDITNGTAMLIYNGKRVNNYVYTVDMQLPTNTGKSVGIVFGSDEYGKYYYYLRVFKLGGNYYYHVVSKDSKGTHDFVAQNKIPGSISAEGMAKMKVIADDVGNLQLYINDIELYNGRVSSTLSAAGYVGLYLKGAVPENAFDNMLVVELVVPDSDDGDEEEEDGGSATTPPAYTPSYTGNTLLSKDFETQEALTDWLQKDEANKRNSVWQIVNGVLKETSDTSVNNGNAFLMYKPHGWSHYEFSVDVTMPDSEGGEGGKSVGLVFGSDSALKNYYYLRIFYNGSDYFKQIYRVTTEGTTTVLAQTRISDLVTGGDVANLRVFAEGTSLKVYLGSNELFSGTDLSGLAGHIGFYLRGTIPNNTFDDLVVKEITGNVVTDFDAGSGDGGSGGGDGGSGSTTGTPSYAPSYTGTTLLEKDFETPDTLSGWLVNDSISTPSVWQVQNGVLTKTNTTSGDSYLLYGRDAWTHYAFSVDVRMPDSESGSAGKNVGVIFGSDLEMSTYYYLRIFYNSDTKMFYRSLIRVTPEGNSRIFDQVRISEGITAGEMAKISVFVEGKKLKIYLNEKEMFSSSELVGLKGCVGLYMRGDMPSNAFDNILVKEITGNATTTANVITYTNLGSATNPNPTVYTDAMASGITLVAPGEREGYKFLGWYLNNQKITNLAGKTGDLTIEARWELEDDGSLELPDIEY